MFRFAIALLAGHCAVHAGVHRLPAVERIYPWVIASCVLLAVLFAVKRTRRAAVIWAAFLCGVLWSGGFAMSRLEHDLPNAMSASPSRTDVIIEGYIASIVEHDASGRRFTFDIDYCDPARCDLDRKPERVELTWYDFAGELLPGERWRLEARLRPRQGFANPGGYDYEAQLFRSGVGATGYVRNGDNRRLAPAGRRYAVLQARHFIAERLQAALPDSPMLGIVQGLAIGETQAMTAEQWRVFSHTGTTHLMAISGLHIAMVAMLFAALMRFVARRLPLQRWGGNAVNWECAGGVSAALIYSLLAGLSVPTQRTLAMLCVYFGMRWRQRELRSLHAFGLALIAVLVVDPLAPLAPGFWLSFGAVAAIMVGFGGRLARGSRSSDYIRMQAVVTAGMMPLTVGAFGSVSLISPLINLLAIPVFTLLLVPPILLAAALASIQASWGAPLLLAVSWLLELLWPAWEWAANLPLALWRVPQLPWTVAILLCAGCTLCIVPSAWMVRIVGAALCLPAVLWSPPRPAIGAFELTMLDVGQGLAIVVRTHSHVLVYDAGPAFRSGRDTGELVVLPFLHALGVRRIDTFVASHGDTDHVGGMQSVLRGIPTSLLLAGPSVVPPPSSQTPLQRCAAGQHWNWDGVDFAVLYPEANVTATARKKNDSSCVLRIGSRNGAATILGDIERDGERALLFGGELAASEIVIVPHHGSRTSSSPELVAAMQAKYALVGAGAGNRWGFPKPDVMARWQAQGAAAFVTAQSGAIRVTVDAEGVGMPQRYRMQRRRYWQPVPPVAIDSADAPSREQGANESW